MLKRGRVVLLLMSVSACGGNAAGQPTSGGEDHIVVVATTTPDRILSFNHRDHLMLGRITSIPGGCWRQGDAKQKRPANEPWKIHGEHSTQTFASRVRHS